MCSGSSIWIFGSKIFNFNIENQIILSKDHKDFILEVEVSKILFECGWIDDCLYTLCYDKFNKTYDIKSNHEHSLSIIDAADNFHPMNFFSSCSNPGLGSPLIGKSPNCLAVEILSTFIPNFTISSWNQMVFVL